MSDTADPAAPTSITIVSDFVCPWCYVGFTEISGLEAKYGLEVRFAPYFLDPSTPPEGKPRKQMSQPGDPPSALEQRGEELGIHFTRGRTWTSNSYIALQAAEFIAHEHPDLAKPFHRRMFRAYFDELSDIGTIDAVVALAEEAGVPGSELRAALESGDLRPVVDDGIAWAREVGVTAVPTFIIDDQYAVVGAQTADVFERVFAQLGKTPLA
jgi:predicted DsbA family dithiol-disulfide isomerase